MATESGTGPPPTGDPGSESTQPKSKEGTDDSSTTERRPDLDLRLGWAPLPRSFRHHPIMKRDGALRLYIWLLLRARHTVGIEALRAMATGNLADASLGDVPWNPAEDLPLATLSSLVDDIASSRAAYSALSLRSICLAKESYFSL